MHIFFDAKTQRFTIETKNTMYVFSVLYGKYLEHLYYGKKTKKAECKRAPFFNFSPYIEEATDISLDTMQAEIPFFGSGDMRCTSLRIKGEDGTGVTEFFYRDYKIEKGRKQIPSLPCAQSHEAEELTVRLFDPVTKCEAELYYTVFHDYDVISRHIKITNHSDKRVVIEKIMSLSLDLPSGDYDMITLHGAHCNERIASRSPVRMGSQSVYSRRGASSHQFNPFTAICKKDAGEERGDVYGFNFVYSGNFLNEVEKSQGGDVRVQLGLGSENFSWILDGGEAFEAPEAVMTYSAHGLGQMSRNFHKFIRDCILPKDTLSYRPVVLNSWEAVFFDINEDLLVDFAKEARENGIDMLVMDDGWFGKRLSDNAGLGDWYENRDRFPNGLKAFAERIRSQGISFGIWVEPEMVNPDSDLYRAHPDWVISVPERWRSLSRSQLVLDMANPDVVRYLEDIFSKTFRDVPIDYIKWDMNRHMSEVGSPTLPPERQGETSFRYMLGVYELLSFFRKEFPNVVLETCSGGGGRYDLGMMKYGNMIWTSDMTWPQMRTQIQNGSMLAYPSCTMSCHVSNPWGDEDDMFFRWAVAIEGMLGYEFNILNLEDNIKKMIPSQIAEYKKYEPLIRNGDFYRAYSPSAIGDFSAYYYVSEDSSKILLTVLQTGDENKKKECIVKVKRANKNSSYIDLRSGKEYTGEELSHGLRYRSADKKYAVVMYLEEIK